jgi:hypothetical protein
VCQACTRPWKYKEETLSPGSRNTEYREEDRHTDNSDLCCGKGMLCLQVGLSAVTNSSHGPMIHCLDICFPPIVQSKAGAWQAILMCLPHLQSLRVLFWILGSQSADGRSGSWSVVQEDFFGSGLEVVPAKHLPELSHTVPVECCGSHHLATALNYER